jgi:hypothetical protein
MKRSRDTDSDRLISITIVSMRMTRSVSTSRPPSAASRAAGSAISTACSVLVRSRVSGERRSCAILSVTTRNPTINRSSLPSMRLS